MKALSISRVDSASWKIGGTGLLFFLTSLVALATTIACWAFRWIYLQPTSEDIFCFFVVVSKLKFVVISSITGF